MKEIHLTFHLLHQLVCSADNPHFCWKQASAHASLHCWTPNHENVLLLDASLDACAPFGLHHGQIVSVSLSAWQHPLCDSWWCVVSSPCRVCATDPLVGRGWPSGDGCSRRGHVLSSSWEALCALGQPIYSPLLSQTHICSCAEGLTSSFFAFSGVRSYFL